MFQLCCVKQGHPHLETPFFSCIKREQVCVVNFTIYWYSFNIGTVYIVICYCVILCVVNCCHKDYCSRKANCYWDVPVWYYFILDHRGSVDSPSNSPISAAFCAAYFTTNLYQSVGDCLMLLLREALDVHQVLILQLWYLVNVGAKHHADITMVLQLWLLYMDRGGLGL